jgi:prepilin-type N-terminal cleavage/methylation domain-containing protein
MQNASFLKLGRFSPKMLQRTTCCNASRNVRGASTKDSGRAGFTLVELLVVLAIIGVLVALLLPAIQSAREASRRTSCGNNLKQLGLGLQNYHDARKSFPYSNVVTSIGQWSSTSAYQGPNWVVAILPFMEGSNVMSLYNKNAYYLDDATNVSFRATTLPFMICPSDSYTLKPFNGTGMSNAGTTGTWARGCYGANATPLQFNSAGNLGPGGWGSAGSRCGVMVPNYGVPMKQISDGTSKTVIVAEMRADVAAVGNRGIWAGTSGTSAFFAHGVPCWNGSNGFIRPDDWGPNNGGFQSDDAPNCNATATFVGAAGTDTAANELPLMLLGMGCYPDGGNQQQDPKSMHLAGVQTLFCDGSLHYINNDINLGTSTANGDNVTANGFWEMLFLSQDNGTVPPDVYGN